MTARIRARTIIRAACIATLALTGSAASATPDKPVIALANAYYGNTWRHQMAQAFEEAARKAKVDGQIADYIVLNGDGSVSQQNSQIAELILKKVDAIAVDAASETAVNGIIEKACAAGHGRGQSRRPVELRA